MARLISAMTCSADLYVEDETGAFDWAEPPEDVHAAFNDLTAEVGTLLHGRRMYETMRFWETMPDEPGVMGEFGRVWRGRDKVVYSASLDGVDTERTRLERRFDPAEVARLKAGAADDLSIGGAAIAGSAMRAGLVDELVLVLVPILVGGGKRALPDGVNASLRLIESRPFDEGWILLRYAVG